MDTNYYEYIFIIYSYKLNLAKANKLYDIYLNNFTDRLKQKVLILYGDKTEFQKTTSDNYIIRDKTLILNVEDDYSNLKKKSVMLFNSIIKIFPNIRGCFKCDDDIILNIDSIYRTQIHIEYCEKNKSPIDYCGKLACILENDIFYCGGPLYYLSNTAMQCFKDVFADNISHPSEDVIVSVVLRENKIFPNHIYLYSDNIMDINVHNNSQHSFHNACHKNTVFQKIHGGLGNQLFQIISGYGIAIKNNMNFVIVDSSASNRKDFTHNTQNESITHTVFGNFPRLTNINTDALKCYKEPPENCFQYSDLKFNHDIFLDGYFQNEKYFSFCRNEIIYKLKSHPQYYESPYYKFLELNTNLRERMTNSYFIHIRRGDYLDNPLYSINYDKYFSSAIDYVLGLDPTAFFFVVSDDIEYCKTYAVLENIKKDLIACGEIETLYFMANCNKGGICSNSTFGWWGSYLNENPDKIVTFPSKWVNNNWVNDIYYNGSIIIDC